MHIKSHVAQSVSRPHPAGVVWDNCKKWSSYKIFQEYKTNNSLSLFKILIVNSSKQFFAFIVLKYDMILLHI